MIIAKKIEDEIEEKFEVNHAESILDKELDYIEKTSKMPYLIGFFAMILIVLIWFVTTCRNNNNAHTQYKK